MGVLAGFLAVPPEQEVRALSRLERGAGSSRDRLLRLVVGGAVAPALAALLDAHEHVRAIRGHGGERRDVGEEQDAIGPRIGDAGRLLKCLGACDIAIEAGA